MGQGSCLVPVLPGTPYGPQITLRSDSWVQSPEHSQVWLLLKTNLVIKYTNSILLVVTNTTKKKQIKEGGMPWKAGTQDFIMVHEAPGTFTQRQRSPAEEPVVWKAPGEREQGGPSQKGRTSDGSKMEGQVICENNVVTDRDGEPDHDKELRRILHELFLLPWISCFWMNTRQKTYSKNFPSSNLLPSLTSFPHLPWFKDKLLSSTLLHAPEDRDGLISLFSFHIALALRFSQRKTTHRVISVINRNLWIRLF